MKESRGQRKRKGLSPLLLAACCAVILGLGIAAWFRHTRDRPGEAGDEEGARKSQEVSTTTVAVEEKPSQPEALETTAVSAVPEPSDEAQYTEDGLEEETMSVMNRLMEDFPDAADPLGLMGDIYVDLGRTSEALACWEKSAELEPQRPSSHLRIVQTFIDRGEFEKAVTVAQKALEIDPKMFGIHKELGRALIGLGKAEEALTALEKAVEIYPRFSINHHLLGQAYQQLGQHEEAKQTYATALQIDPDSTDACYGMATACARLGQTDEAARYREKFKEMKALDWQTVADKGAYGARRPRLAVSRRHTAATRTNVGMVYAMNKQLQAAEKHWLRAAVLDPENTGCREQLATLYRYDGRKEEALEMCERLRQLVPENAQYHMATGDMLSRLNRFEAAIQAIEKAIELEPDNESYFEMYEQILKRKQDGDS